MLKRQESVNSNHHRIDGRKAVGFFIVLGFNDTSARVGHFVSSPREEGEKR